MTDFTLTYAGARGESAADLSRRLGFASATASDTEALLAILNRTTSVVAAATGNVSTTTAPSTLDGVTLASGDKVLLHAQTSTAQNGIYVFSAAGAALTRWTGTDAWYELPGLLIGVAGGATHANTSWAVFNEHGGTIGTTSVTILKLAGSLNALLSLANTWAQNQTVGAGTGLRLMRVNGGSGSGEGAAFQYLTGGVANAAIGHFSAILGGAYDATLLYYTGAAAHSWYIGSERMRLDASGNLGLGSPSLGARLAVRLPSAAAANAIHLNTTDASSVGHGCAITFGHGQVETHARIRGYATNSNAGHLILETNNGAGFVERVRIEDAGAVRPGADNTQTLGNGSCRWSTVYAGTGTINTSDANEKSEFTAIPDGVKRAARTLMAEIGVFQWLEAIARKGEDGARLHLGVKAQAVRDAFLAEGVDPGRWGLFCEDPILAPVEKRRSATRQVVRTDQTARQEVTIENGRAVMRVVEEAVEVPVFETLPLVDEAGQPVLIDGVPATWQAPVMETFEEPYSEMEPTGETRLGLRHDQLMMLFIAVMAAG